MTYDLDDEQLMRRFLVGQVSDEEESQIEDRFMGDPDYFDALCALEEEMMLAHARGELPVEWRPGFRKRVLDAPARRAHADQVVAFADALREAHSALRVTPAPTLGWRQKPSTRLWLAAAAALVVAVALAVSRQREDVPPPSDVRSPAVSAPAGTFATFVLAPGLARSELGQQNVIVLQAEATQVQLELTIRSPMTTAPLRAALRTVGGPSVDLPTAPVITESPAGMRVICLVATRLIPRGDYVLSIVPEADPDGEPLARRFFTVEGSRD